MMSGIIKTSSTAAKEIEEATDESLEGCRCAIHNRKRKNH
jgi:hypothetical protein